MTLHAPLTLRSADNQLFVSGYPTERPLHVHSDHPNWEKSSLYLNSRSYLEWLASKIELPVSEGSKEDFELYISESKDNYSKWIDGSYDISELAGRIEVVEEHMCFFITLLPEKEEGQDELIDQMFLASIFKENWQEFKPETREKEINKIKQKFTIIKNK
jgi:hypothetical protein